jgi:hypothetical protein
MVFTIQKEWKEFNISIPNLQTELKANYPQYVGCSANSKLELHFSSEPSQEEKDTIDAYYESLDGSDYVSAEDLKAQEDELEAAILVMKQAVISKTWANMSAVERKIVVGLKPTREEMGL